MANTLTIDNIVIYSNAGGDIRGDIDIILDGIWASESFSIYASGNWEFRGWQYSRLYTKVQKKAIESAIIAKVARTAYNLEQESELN